MEELKKEFDKLFTKSINHPYRNEYRVNKNDIEKFIEGNFVPKSEFETKLAIKGDAIRAYDMYSDYILGEIEQLKAENEKLSAQYAMALGTIEQKKQLLNEISKVIQEAPELNPSNYTHDEACELNNKMIEAYGILNQANVKGDAFSNTLAEARKETKEAIEKVLMKRLMDGSIDFIKIDATRLSKEFDEAIEPQQSCEGCEYNSTNNECSADFDCFNFSHYQPQTKEVNMENEAEATEVKVVKTAYSEKEVIDFGNYLLSQEREERISEENKRRVTHADLTNWRESQ